MDDSELLYDDLFENLENGHSVIKTSFHELEERIQQLNDENDRLKMQISDLHSQNEKIAKQNDVLIRNISCLFKTAQMEIARKDKQIRSLQEEAFKASLDTGRTTASPATETSNGRETHAMDRSKYMGKSNRIGDVSDGASCQRKRTACDVQYAGTVIENNNACGKRLESVDRETVDKRRPRENSYEGSKRADQSNRKFEGYIEEKEARSSRDEKNGLSCKRSHDINDRNHNGHAAVNGGYDEGNRKGISQNSTSKIEDKDRALKCNRSSMHPRNYDRDTDVFNGHNNINASEKYEGNSESYTKQVDWRNSAERGRMRWSKPPCSARDGTYGNAGNEIHRSKS